MNVSMSCCFLGGGFNVVTFLFSFSKVGLSGLHDIVLCFKGAGRSIFPEELNVEVSEDASG